MTESLSDNQQRLMVALRRRGQLSTERAGAVRDRHREELGHDVARKVLSRLELRGLVTGVGRGMVRLWELTAAGLAVIDGVAPVGEQEGSRPYFVLEELDLRALLVKRLESAGLWSPAEIDDILAPLDYIFDPALAVYIHVDKVVGVNGAHAYRQVGKLHYPVGMVPTLVAIAERMFQPRRVKVNDDPSVSIT